MIIRIVRMTFQPEKTEAFLAIFRESKAKIRHFEGCQHLELWQDADQPNVFTTFSHWKDADSLEHYRQSALFKATWERTKVLFAARPIAYSNHLKMAAD